MNKLYASLVLRTLTSTDRKTLSIFIKLLEKNKEFNPELSKKSKIKDICKELAENKKKEKKRKEANEKICIKGILSYFHKLILNNSLL